MGGQKYGCLRYLPTHKRKHTGVIAGGNGQQRWRKKKDAGEMDSQKKAQTMSCWAAEATKKGDRGAVSSVPVGARREGILQKGRHEKTSGNAHQEGLCIQKR